MNIAQLDYWHLGNIQDKKTYFISLFLRIKVSLARVLLSMMLDFVPTFFIKQEGRRSPKEMCQLLIVIPLKPLSTALVYASIQQTVDQILLQ